MYGRTILQVRLVAGAARDNEDVAVAKARAERGQLEPGREALRLVAQVEQGVLGERLERLREAPLVLCERSLERRRVELRPLREERAVAPDVPALDAYELPVRELSKRRAPGASTSRTPARTSSSGPAFGNLPVDDGATLTTTRTPLSTSSSAETRSRSAWSTIATSSGRSRLTRSFVRRPSRAGPETSPFPFMFPLR